MATVRKESPAPLWSASTHDSAPGNPSTPSTLSEVSVNVLSRPVILLNIVGQHAPDVDTVGNGSALITYEDSCALYPGQPILHNDRIIYDPDADNDAISIRISILAAALPAYKKPLGLADIQTILDYYPTLKLVPDFRTLCSLATPLLQAYFHTTGNTNQAATIERIWKSQAILTVLQPKTPELQYLVSKLLHISKRQLEKKSAAQQEVDRRSALRHEYEHLLQTLLYFPGATPTMFAKLLQTFFETYGHFTTHEIIVAARLRVEQCYVQFLTHIETGAILAEVRTDSAVFCLEPDEIWERCADVLLDLLHPDTAKEITHFAGEQSCFDKFHVYSVAFCALLSQSNPFAKVGIVPFDQLVVRLQHVVDNPQTLFTSHQDWQKLYDQTQLNIQTSFAQLQHAAHQLDAAVRIYAPEDVVAQLPSLSLLRTVALTDMK